jgi:hypothetical protein
MYMIMLHTLIIGEVFYNGYTFVVIGCNIADRQKNRGTHERLWWWGRSLDFLCVQCPVL